MAQRAARRGPAVRRVQHEHQDRGGAGSALLAWGLAAVGYDPAAVTDAVADGITWLYLGLPIALALLQIVAIAPYDLQRRLPALRAELAARRAAGV